MSTSAPTKIKGIRARLAHLHQSTIQTLAEPAIVGALITAGGAITAAIINSDQNWSDTVVSAAATCSTHTKPTAICIQIEQQASEQLH